MERTIPVTLNYEADKPVGNLVMSEELEQFLLRYNEPMRFSVAISHAERQPRLIQLALITEVRPVNEEELLDQSRRSAVALSGLTDTIYLGDCVREWARALRRV